MNDFVLKTIDSILNHVKLRKIVMMKRIDLFLSQQQLLPVIINPSEYNKLYIQKLSVSLTLSLPLSGISYSNTILVVGLRATRTR